MGLGSLDEVIQPLISFDTSPHVLLSFEGRSAVSAAGQQRAARQARGGSSAGTALRRGGEVFHADATLSCNVGLHSFTITSRDLLRLAIHAIHMLANARLHYREHRV